MNILRLAAAFVGLLLVCLATLNLASIANAQEDKADEPEALKVGDQAPDFEVTGIDGEKFKLSEKIGEKGKNVVILFSRASW